MENFNQIKRVLLLRDKCDNSPYNPAHGCKGYICPLWKYNNGLFDESGKEINYIIEIKYGGTNEINNLQVLCQCCHSIKNKDYENFQAPSSKKQRLS